MGSGRMKNGVDETLIEEEDEKMTHSKHTTINKGHRMLIGLLILALMFSLVAPSSVNAAVPALTVSETDTLVLDPLTEGYNVPDTMGIEKPVILTKVGALAITNLSITLSGTGSNSFVVGTVNSNSLGDGVLSTVFNIRPKWNLAVGTHTMTVTITADDDINHSFNVSFTVNAAPPSTMTVSETGTLVLDSLTEGYNSAAALGIAKPVTLTKVGVPPITNLSMTLSGTGSGDFWVGTARSDTLGPGVISAQFNIRPKQNLAVGTHMMTVTITADNGINHSFNVSFTVSAAPTFNSQPIDAAIKEGGDTTFTVAASNAVTYQWQVKIGVSSYVDVADAGPYTGASTDTLAIAGATAGMDGYSYRVIARGTLASEAVSNQAVLTVYTEPEAPTGVNATAGNGQASVAFTAPTNNGGSPFTGYEVMILPGGSTVVGTSSPITITGLTNGTSYTFTVKAINAAGGSIASASSNAVIPASPSSGSDSGSTSPTTSSPPKATSKSVNVLVNGELEDAGIATTSTVNNQTVTIIVLDQKKLEDKLAIEGRRAIITIPVNVKSNVVIGELNAQLINIMNNMEAVLELKTDRATYTIPAQQFNMSALLNQFGAAIALQDIKVQIEIAEPTADRLKVIENAAAKGKFTLVTPPLSFTVRVSHGGKTIELPKFNGYVERTIAIPDGVDPNRMTTGVVVEPDGTVHHIPTAFVVIAGKHYAKLNSWTNGTYSVVWHPLEFTDVANHWAKDSINAMGSRMVIDGFSDGLFKPDQPITRAEFAAVIVRGLGLRVENGAAPFSDVKTSDWHGSAVQTVYAYNLISGFEDDTFRPQDNITREQAMAIIARAMKITGLKAKLPTEAVDEQLNSFTDAHIVSKWARSSLADSLQAGIVTGRTSDELAPLDVITRAGVVFYVQKLLQKSGLI
jgi:hypothetical protein